MKMRIWNIAKLCIVYLDYKIPKVILSYMFLSLVAASVDEIIDMHSMPIHTCVC